MSLTSKFISFLKTEPAVALWAVNAAAAFIAAFWAGATPGWTAGVSAVASAVITVITALAARPVSIPVITGAVATGVEAAVAAGWVHVTAHQIGLAIPVLSIVLSLILRQAITPLVTLRQQHEPEHAIGIVQHLEPPRLADEDVQRIAAAVTHPQPVSWSLSDDEVTRVATQVAAAIKPARQPRTPRTT